MGKLITAALRLVQLRSLLRFATVRKYYDARCAWYDSRPLETRVTLGAAVALVVVLVLVA